MWMGEGRGPQLDSQRTGVGRKDLALARRPRCRLPRGGNALCQNNGEDGVVASREGISDSGQRSDEELCWRQSREGDVVRRDGERGEIYVREGCDRDVCGERRVREKEKVQRGNECQLDIIQPELYLRFMAVVSAAEEVVPCISLVTGRNSKPCFSSSHQPVTPEFRGVLAVSLPE